VAPSETSGDMDVDEELTGGPTSRGTCSEFQKGPLDVGLGCQYTANSGSIARTYGLDRVFISQDTRQVHPCRLDASIPADDGPEK
jgi:hypothetical protein